jgi:hypothetical protein
VLASLTPFSLLKDLACLVYPLLFFLSFPFRTLRVPSNGAPSLFSFAPPYCPLFVAVNIVVYRVSPCCRRGQAYYVAIGLLNRTLDPFITPKLYYQGINEIYEL